MSRTHVICSTCMSCGFLYYDEYTDIDMRNDTDYRIDWEYFIGSKLAWAKYSTSFNFVKLACVAYFTYS